jgi:hypothetical protein
MSYEEQKKRGEEIYNAQIRSLISEADADKYVMVDVLSGDYEVGEDSTKTGLILRERRPDAVIHGIRNHETYVGRLRSPRNIRYLEDAQ